MNAIFTKCSPKRKYTRKPKCANIGGICTWDKCRCDYPLKASKSIQKIDEYLHHREKVIKRRREIDLQRLDSELEIDRYTTGGENYLTITGEFAKRKELKAKYKRMAWLGLEIIMYIVLFYLLLINFFGI